MTKPEIRINDEIRMTNEENKAVNEPRGRRLAVSQSSSFGFRH